MPCLNEEETIGESVRQAREAIARLGVTGEVIVIDSDSSDRSREIALREGAMVVNQPERGYGNAYLLGFKVARGKYVVMGDPDATHDFREIGKFIEYLKQSYDFVMGSRFKGKILPGSMPLLHRYVGNPVIYKIMRLFFKTRVSDINCGLRAITMEAYHRLNLRTGDWEFALEMVVKAARNKLKIAEVPITYYPRGGESKLRSFYAGWRNLRFILLYCPNYLFLAPGLIMLVVGLGLVFALLGGELHIAGRLIGLHFSVLGALLSILGFQTIALGAYAKVYSMAEGFGEHDTFTEFLNRYFNLERGVIWGGIVFLLGLLMNVCLLYMKLIDTANYNTVYIAIPAMTLTLLGVGTILSSFFLSVLQIRRKD
jgi:glycosyltransferase involved in cell wall biosynthesis